MNIHTVSIKHGRTDQEQVRALIGSDQVLVVDYDAIRKGVINTAEYTYLSHLFEIIVLNLSSRLNDVIDTIMSGASMVVISEKTNEKRMREFFDVTENIALPFTDSGSSSLFSGMGGQYYFTDRPVPYPFKTAYAIKDLGERYVRVLDFPEDIAFEIFGA